MSHFDIAIIGAGIAGSSLACGLANSHYRIALIDASPLQVSPPPSAEEFSVNDYDLRVSALTMSSINLFKGIGVWQQPLTFRLSEYHHMSVWDADGTGQIDFDAQEVNQRALGVICENRLIVHCLHQQLASQANVKTFMPDKMLELQAEGEGYCISLNNDRQITCDLLIGADGANSKVREWAKLTVRSWPYGHTAIVATIKTEKPHSKTAWQRFIPEGPLALLPLAGGDDHYCSIVWSTETEQATELMELDEQEFAKALGIASEFKLGEVLEVSERRSFPLLQRHATDYIKPGLALIGDAAHSIHPLAGQGINLGLKDVEVLLDELKRAEQRQLSPGDLSVLGRYQRRRKGDNLAMMAAMEGFKRLFEARQLSVRWLRNEGMRLLGRSTPVKRQLIKQAMGL